MKSPERIALAALAPQPWKNGAGLTRELAVEPRGASMSDFAWRISLAEVERDGPFSAFRGIARNITLLRGAGMRLLSIGAASERDAVRWGDRSPDPPSARPEGRSGSPPIDHSLSRPLEPFAFPGDIALQATLFGGPCADFNVMTRRGAWRADVRVHRHAVEPTGLDDGIGADATLLLCVHGHWQIEAGATDHDSTWLLAPGEALLWREPCGALWATPQASPATAPARTAPTTTVAMETVPSGTTLTGESALICVRLCHDAQP